MYSKGASSYETLIIDKFNFRHRIMSQGQHLSKLSKYLENQCLPRSSLYRDFMVMTTLKFCTLQHNVVQVDICDIIRFRQLEIKERIPMIMEVTKKYLLHVSFFFWSL